VPAVAVLLADVVVGCVVDNLDFLSVIEGHESVVAFVRQNTGNAAEFAYNAAKLGILTMLGVNAQIRHSFQRRFAVAPEFSVASDDVEFEFFLGDGVSVCDTDHVPSFMPDDNAGPGEVSRELDQVTVMDALRPRDRLHVGVFADGDLGRRNFDERGAILEVEVEFAKVGVAARSILFEGGVNESSADGESVVVPCGVDDGIEITGKVEGRERVEEGPHVTRMSDQIVAERLVNSLHVKHDVRIRISPIARMGARSVHVHLIVDAGKGGGESDG